MGSVTGSVYAHFAKWFDARNKSIRTIKERSAAPSPTPKVHVEKNQEKEDS